MSTKYENQLEGVPIGQNKIIEKNPKLSNIGEK